jgi:hypothetical protein
MHPLFANEGANHRTGHDCFVPDALFQVAIAISDIL